MKEIKKEEMSKEEGVEKKIKCFVLAGGNNVISEYEERPNICPDGSDVSEMEWYWINPMQADYIKLNTGQTVLVMVPLITFNQSDEVGPINVFSVLTSYEVEEKFKKVYEDNVLKLRASRLGLVKANELPKQPTIGSGLKIV